MCKAVVSLEHHVSSALVCECVRPFSGTHACISGIPTVTDPSDIVRYVSVVLREYVCYAQVTQVMFPCVETSGVSRVCASSVRPSLPPAISSIES